MENTEDSGVKWSIRAAIVAALIGGLLGGIIGAVLAAVIVGSSLTFLHSYLVLRKNPHYTLIMGVFGIVIFILGIVLSLFAVSFIASFFISPQVMTDTSTETSTEHTYINSQYGFQVNYPSTWTQLEGQLEQTIVKFSSNDGLARVTLKKYANSNQLTSDEMFQYVEDNEQSFRQSLESTGLESIRIEKATISGIPVHRVTYFETSSGIKTKVISYTVVLNKDTYLGINYVATSNDFDLHVQEGNEIVASFKII